MKDFRNIAISKLPRVSSERKKTTKSYCRCAVVEDNPRLKQSQIKIESQIAAPSSSLCSITARNDKVWRFQSPCRENKISKMYQILFDHYGKQYWWPAETKLEIIIGAILTQNTAWKNVEKAIDNLKEKKLIDLKRLSKLSVSELGNMIRASGFYNIKAKRLKAFIDFLNRECAGKLYLLKKKKTEVLRKKMLGVYGIGEETADSILLYALDKPVFVVDAYTKRILHRHHLIANNAKYSEVANLFIRNLPKSVKIYQEFHALLVRLAKEYCKFKPICQKCPIKEL